MKFFALVIVVIVDSYPVQWGVKMFQDKKSCEDGKAALVQMAKEQDVNLVFAPCAEVTIPQTKAKPPKPEAGSNS